MKTNRFMSGASIATMAAFAPPNEGGADTSKIGQPERVDEAAPADGGDGLGLSAEEQAQFDAMQGRESGIAPPAEREAGAGADGPSNDADEVDGAGADGDAAAGEATDGSAEGAQDGSGERRTPKTISYGRHQRDLAALQAKFDGATAEVTKEREARVRLDERTKQLLEAIQAKPAPAADAAATAAAEAAKDPEPDGEADPIGHLQWQNRKLAKTVEDLQSGRQQEQQQTAAEREDARVYGVYEADLTREAAADPAFADAFVHLRETRYRELGFIYADIDITDPAQCAQLSAEDQSKLSDSIQRSFHNEQMLVARQALQSKKSPAKVVANLARARGFVPKAPAAANGAAPAGDKVPAKVGNGATRAVAPADAGTVTDQLQAIRDGQEASRSLSDAGGSPGGTITPDRLANMSDDEFEQFYNQMPKGRFDQLMGKPATQ